MKGSKNQIYFEFPSEEAPRSFANLLTASVSYTGTFNPAKMAPFPVMQTPVTDFGDNFTNYDAMKQCRPFYLQFAKCEAAYGAGHGAYKCM